MHRGIRIWKGGVLRARVLGTLGLGRRGLGTRGLGTRVLGTMVLVILGGSHNAFCIEIHMQNATPEAPKMWCACKFTCEMRPERLRQCVLHVKSHATCAPRGSKTTLCTPIHMRNAPLAAPKICFARKSTCKMRSRGSEHLFCT